MEQINSHDSEAAAALRELADEFRFEEIIAKIDAAIKEKDADHD